jgi:hypothetical protein
LTGGTRAKVAIFAEGGVVRALVAIEESSTPSAPSILNRSRTTYVGVQIDHPVLLMFASKNEFWKTTRA